MWNLREQSYRNPKGRASWNEWIELLLWSLAMKVAQEHCWIRCPFIYDHHHQSLIDVCIIGINFDLTEYIQFTMIKQKIFHFQGWIFRKGYMSNHFSLVRKNPHIRTLIWIWSSLENSDLGLALRPVFNLNYCYHIKNCSHYADEIHLHKLAAVGLFKAYTDIGFVLTSAQQQPLAGLSPQEWIVSRKHSGRDSD